jgi:hypothetical protein
MCFSRGIPQITTTPYYPQPSHAERFNRNLRAARIAYHHQNHSCWDENELWLQFDFNSTRHDSERSNSFQLIFTYTPNSPLSALWSIKDLLPDNPDPHIVRERWNSIRKNLRLAHDKVRRYYDRYRKPYPFSIESQVWLRNYLLAMLSKALLLSYAPGIVGHL